jgi:hypothetical protein
MKILRNGERSYTKKFKILKLRIENEKLKKEILSTFK